MPDPSESQTIRLSDGRTLGYAEYGDPAGPPVLEFHGWPSCRLEALAWDEPAKAAGARVIAIDRPGIGLSTYKRGYRIVDWPADVLELAGQLGIDRFAVAGISSGAPYSLACAALIPERLTACAVVSGLPPLHGARKPEDLIIKDEIQIARLARRVPWLANPLFRFFAWQTRRNPDKSAESYMKHAPDADRDVMSRPEIKEGFAANFKETTRQGAGGVLASVALEVQPWGFDLQSITMPVALWHGEQDHLAFPAGVHYVHERLPNSTLNMIPNAGHMSTIVDHAGDVLRGLIDAGTRPAATETTTG